VDTAGFLALFGLFTAHVTGGLVSVGLVLAYSSPSGLVSRLAMVVVFVAAVAGTTLIVRRLGRSGKAPVTTLLSLMAFALALFSVTGIALESAVVSADSWAAIVIGAAAVTAMAVQNTLMRSTPNGTSPTTIMTGNLTQVTIDTVELILPAPASSESSRERRRTDAKGRLVKFGAPLSGFIFGVCTGAVMTHAMGLRSILVPTVTVLTMAAMSWRREFRG
jgi:uncharacterized membrane protein YoaK (UPF0700 family)